MHSHRKRSKKYLKFKRISGADNYPTIPLSPLAHIPGICNFQPFDVSNVYLFLQFTYHVPWWYKKVDINICTSFISERDLLLEMMQILRYLCSCWLNTSASSFSLPYFSRCPYSSQEYKANQWHFLFKVREGIKKKIDFF